MAEIGCHWMLTPDRRHLVHATQRPVCQPELLSSSGTTAGDRMRRSQGRVRMHGPTTGKFEVEASWSEWVDDVEKPGPSSWSARPARRGPARGEPRQPLRPRAGGRLALRQHDPVNRPRARGDRHEFGDTKFRRDSYTMRATTRFREYLPTALFEQRDEVTRVGPIAEGRRRRSAPTTIRARLSSFRRRASVSTRS